jgi:hypothetical protein
MNTFTQSALFFAVAALTPLAVQANMAELSDADLRAVQGQATLGPGFQAYRAEMGSMWSDLTTVLGHDGIYDHCLDRGRLRCS